MKTKQLWLIAAIAVIIWSCNSNQTSKPAANLPLTEHTSTKAKTDLLAFSKKNQTTTSTELKKKNHISKTKFKEKTFSDEASYRSTTNNNEQHIPLTLESLYKELDAPVQNYEINPNEDNTIVCDKGTEIFIPKGSFELKNKEDDNSLVSIHVKEYYSTSDFIFGNLATSSNNNLIESGGTIFIEAYQANEPVSLKEDKKIELTFPQKEEEEFKAGMELFTGNRNQINQPINWQRGGRNGFIASSKRGNPYKPNATPKKTYVSFEKLLKKSYKLPKDESFKKYRKDVVFKMIIDPKGKLISVTTDSILRTSVENKIMPILNELNKWDIKNNNYWLLSKKKIKNADTLTEYITLKFRNRKVKVSKADTYKEDKQSAQRKWRLNRNDLMDRNGNSQTILKDSASNATLKYAFSTNTLGWINCDRFIGTDKPLTNVIAKASDTENSDYKLIFKDIRSIMPGYVTNDGFEFPNIPVGHIATLLAIKIKDEKIFVSKKTVVAGTLIHEVQFMEVTKDELKNMVSSLDL